MAILFDSGDGDGVDYLDNNSPSITDFPVTFSCWVKPDSTSDQGACITLGTNGSNHHYISLLTYSGSNIRAQTRGAGGAAYATGPSSYSAGTWQHIAGVFRNSASRIAYLDGVAGTENTTNRNASGMDRIVIGELAGPTSKSYDGSLADCAIWDVALSAEDVSALALGFNPSLIQPSNLVSYYPFVREYIDQYGNNELTPNNTVNYSEHAAVQDGASPTTRSAWGGI